MQALKAVVELEKDGQTASMAIAAKGPPNPIQAAWLPFHSHDSQHSQAKINLREPTRLLIQLLVRLQQAILQPCASYACEVWAPASACIGPFRNLQQLQRTLLRRACRVKKSVPVGHHISGAATDALN